MAITILEGFWSRIWSKLAYIFSENYQGLTKNPRWLLMRKIAKFKTVRTLVRLLSKASDTSYQFSVKDKNSCLQNLDIDVDAAVKTLKHDGLYLDLSLPEEMVQQIVNFAKSQVCYGNKNPNLGFYYHQKQQAEATSSQHFILASYFNTGLLCPAIAKLQNDPILLEIAAKYLQSKPVHQGNRLWWSFAGEVNRQEKSEAAQMFHYDLEDYSSLNFFFYLTDVDLSGGPHVCIRGSHEKKKFSNLLIRKRETDQNMIDYYGQESIVTIVGKAGYGFAEDPLCFHKAMTPTQQDRLILQLQFATTNYGILNDLKDFRSLKKLSISEETIPSPTISKSDNMSPKP